MEDIILIAVILAVVIGVIIYIVKAKKRGQRCIGCPYGGKCSKCGSKERK